MGKIYPSQETLLASFSYDEITGDLRHKTTLAKNAQSGDVAGYANSTGYIQISMAPYGKLRAHRMVWIMVYGPIPDGMQIDHIDGNRSNNAIKNLRLATVSQNGANRDANSNKCVGSKGVYLDRRSGRWKVQIKVRGKIEYVGMYDELEQATSAYKTAAILHFGEYAR